MYVGRHDKRSNKGLIGTSTVIPIPLLLVPGHDGRGFFYETFTAKLLFLCKRARPDIQTAVAFLTTRVIAPDVDDWKKLARVVNYLRLTAQMYLTLESDGSGILKWWVDGAFAVHLDTRSHTGATMLMGRWLL